MFNEYPYRNLSDVNLDYILKHIKELATNLQDFIKLNTIKYADPIDWNISKQYEANTVVVNDFTGVAYLSTKPVPSGVDVTNTDYWTPIFTLDFVNMNKNITIRNDGNNNNATFASVTGDWLIVGGQLYKVIQDIALHTAYVVGYNIQIYSAELFVRDYLNQVLNLIGDLEELNTPDKSSIVNAINSAYKFAPKTPLYFGCVGDGVTDDTIALNAYFKYCSDNGYSCDGLGLTYLIDKVDDDNTLLGHYGALIRGGRHITNFNFVLATDVDHSTCCLMIDYDSNPVFIDHCTFKGGIYPNNTGGEDGANHAIYINSNNSVHFPDNWQSYGDIFIDDCLFYDTWSYSVFPAPLNGTLCITNCEFLNARTCAILPYATNVIIDNCDFNLATHAYILLGTMCDMEIEQFNNDNVKSKMINLMITNCNSHSYHLIRDTHIGRWIYDKVYLFNNTCSSVFTHDPGVGGQLTMWNFYAENNLFVHTGDLPIKLTEVQGNINIIDSKFIDDCLFNVTGAINFKNCSFGAVIYLNEAQLTSMSIDGCGFENVSGGSSGVITAVNDSTPTHWGILIMNNCYIGRIHPIFWKTNFSAYYINDCKALYNYTKLCYALDNFTANMYINNLIVGVAYADYEYLVSGFTGNVIVTNSKFTDNLPISATGTVSLSDILVNDEPLNNNLSAAIDITGYTDYSNSYTAPSDGYIIIGVNALDGASANASLYIRSFDGSNVLTVIKRFTEAYSFEPVFVKKGFKIYIPARTTDTTVNFMAISYNH